MTSLFLLIASMLFLEHADTPEKRERGLMGRKEMAENHGMLFHFDREGFYSFWSMNCHLSLSLAFLKEDGVIVEIADLEAYPGLFPDRESDEKRRFFQERALFPKKRARYVLEVPKGWFERAGVQVGDHLQWEGERGFFSKSDRL